MRLDGTALGGTESIVPLIVSLLYNYCMFTRTFSTFPLTPTKVPRLVYRRCDADNETERREYGAPMTSKRASVWG